jgi:hypothetical protein
MNKKVILATLATITLAACSNDDEQYADFTSPVEVNFSAQVRGTTARTASTRDDNSDETANTSDTWSSGGHDKIGVTLTTLSTTSTQSAANFRNILYTTTSTGSTTTKTSFTTDATNKFYFQTPKEYAYFSAYAPYTSSTDVDENNNINVEPSTPNTDGISVPDYIWAETGKLNYSNASPTLAFNHKMAQLQVVVKLGESVSVEQPSANVDEPSTYSSQIESVKLSNITSTGTFNIGTGAVTLGDTKASASLSADNGSEGQTATSPVYTILPQSGITVTITTEGFADNSDVNSNTYQVTLPELIAGNSYVYTITAQKTEVEVSATIKEWESEEGTLTASMKKTSVDQYEVFDELDLVQQYDLAFSDGTFMRIADSEGNFPSTLTLPEDKTVSGIVYWIGDVTADDPILKRDYPSCTHGLIVALDNAAGYNDCVYWQNKADDVYANFQCAENSLYSETKGYKKIQTAAEKAILQAKLGYNNTVVLRAYNDYKAKNSLTENQVQPVLKVDAYAKNHDAPMCSSGWYLPSPVEMVLWCENVSEWKIASNSISTNSVMINLNSVFALLSDASVTCAKFENSVSSSFGIYWSSLEGSESNAYTLYLYYSYCYYASLNGRPKDDSSARPSVRAVCAF